MTTDADLDASVRRVLGELLALGAPYTAIPLIDPATKLPPAPTVDAIRAPLESAVVDIDESIAQLEPAVASLETLVDDGRLSEPNLTSTIGSVAADAVNDSAVSRVAPTAPTLRHDFSAAADTTAGTIGAPEIGPAGNWALSGPGTASARILSGQFISPTGGVTYAVKRLTVRPTVVRVRNIWTGVSGPTFAVLADQVSFNISTWNGVHIQTTKDSINGFLAIPNAEGGPTGTPDILPLDPDVMALVDGVEYETRGDFDWDRGLYTITVTRVSDNKVMGAGTFYDDSLPTRVPDGPTQFMIEPGNNVGYTFADTFPSARADVISPVYAPGGISGPIGAEKRAPASFTRVHIGTGTPGETLLRIVGSTVGAVPRVESSHAGGAGLRIIGTAAGAAATLRLQRSNEADDAGSFLKSSSNGLTLGSYIAGAEVEIVRLNRTSGIMTLISPTGNGGRLIIQGQGSGTEAVLDLQAGSGTASRIYQGFATSDFRIRTSGTDRVVITSGGQFVLGTTSVTAGSGTAGTTLVLGNITTPPSGNPTGGIQLYSEGGVFKVRGGSGTVTTLAPA